jgi:hypothetical protein
MRRFGVLFAAAAVWLAGVGMPLAHADFLSDFVDANGDSNGNSFHYAGLTFSDFTYRPIDQAPTASQVTVAGVTDVFGNTGINFGGAWTPTAATNPIDWRLTYTVTRDDGAGFTDIHMTGNPLVTPMGSTGSSIVTETVSGDNPPQPGLGTISIYSINNGGGPVTQDTDSLSWSTPSLSLHVEKDIFLSNGTGIATLSFFDQTFSVVPEPGSIVLMGMGCLGMIGYGLKRRRSMGV